MGRLFLRLILLLESFRLGGCVQCNPVTTYFAKESDLISSDLQLIWANLFMKERKDAHLRALNEFLLLPAVVGKLVKILALFLLVLFLWTTPDLMKI